MLQKIPRHDGIDISQVYDPVAHACRKLAPLFSTCTDVAIDLLSFVLTSEEKLPDALDVSVQSRKVIDAVLRICDDCTNGDASEFRPASIVDELGLQRSMVMVSQTLETMQGGNLTCGVPAVVDYLARKNIEAEGFFAPWRQLAPFTGPWIAHPMFCVLGDFPVHLSVNAAGHLHSDEGPACRWSDGTRIYFLNGVQVGSRFVDDPESTTAENLEKMKPAQRAVCFDKTPKREQVLFAIHEMEDKEKT